MKKATARYIGVLLPILFAQAAFAQYDPGKKMIGGFLNFGTNLFNENSVTAKTRNTTFHFNISLSRFKTSSLVTGFGFYYGHSYNNNDAGNPAAIRSYSNNAGISYELIKLQPIGNKVQVAFGGVANTGYSIGKVMPGNTKTQSLSVGASGNIGIWYHLTQRLILTGSFTNLFYINYAHGWNSSQASSSSFLIGTGLSGMSLNAIGLGVRYLLK